MKASQNCINLIKKFEGCRLDAYKCPAGVWTIGYGHTSGVKQGQKISQNQADVLLAQDLVKYETQVMKYNAKYNWSQNEFDALVSFAFNIGSINQLVANGTRDKKTIAAKMLEYNKAAGKVLTGLTRRRKEENELFLKGGAVSSMVAQSSQYTVGKNYTLQNDMYVRTSAGGTKKKFVSMTVSAKSNGYADKEGNGVLKAGTVVTCKGIEKIGDASWMRIPTGYVCAVGKEGKIYIK